MKYRNIILLVAFFGVAIFVTANIIQESDSVETDIERFTTESEMIDYLEASREDDRHVPGIVGEAEYDYTERTDAVTEPVDESVQDGTETFEQTPGIQEPDFVKLDDRLYYSPPAYRSKINTTALNIPDLDIEKNITEAGDLLLLEDILVILGDDKLTAYDLDDYSSEWQKDLGAYAEDDMKSRIVTARAFENSVLLVLQTDIDYSNPCPYMPMEGVTIPCRSIIYPGYNVNADRAYTAIKLDLEGNVEQKNSFIGDYSTEIYVTEESVYITYNEREKTSDIIFDFLLDYASIPTDLENRILEIKDYDLSERSIMIETERAITEKLSESDLEELGEDMESYTENRKREVEETKIIRFNNNLEEEYVTTVPGNIRDRENLYEHDGKLYGLSRISPHSALGHFSSTYDFFVIEEGENVEYIEDFHDTFIMNIEFYPDEFYVSDREELSVYSLEDYELIEKIESALASMHPFGEGKLVVGQTENRNTTFMYLDEDFVLQDRVVTENTRYFGSANIQVDSDKMQAIASSYSKSFVLELEDEDLVVEEINATGRSSFITEDYIYVIDSDSVHVFDETLEEYTYFEVPLSDRYRGVDRPLPETEEMVVETSEDSAESV